MTDLMTIDQAVQYLGISTSSLYALAQSGRIPALKVGKQWRFSKLDVEEWVRAQQPLQDFFKNVPFFIDENMLLRDPQIEAHANAMEFFENGGREAVILLPVGCGKSGLISILPFGIAEGRVLVIAPNLTIRDELERALDVSNRRQCFWRKCDVLRGETMTAGPYLAVLKGDESNVHDCDASHLVLTNIQQLASSADRWLPDFPDSYFDLILVDEGHHSAAESWKKVFERFPKAKIVNLTATPFRSDRKDIQGELVYKYSFKRAMIKGYIKKLQSVSTAPSVIEFTYQDDDYRLSLEEVLQMREDEWFSRGVALAPKCNEHIVEAALDRLEQLRQSGTNHQLIAVAMSIHHAKQIRSLFSEKGYEAQEIHSQMARDERDKVLQRLRSGILDCIIQVQILGEGFDHPQLSVAAIFRPFRSLAPYIQFVGRIMRVIVQNDPRHPDNYGFIVTHVGLNLDKQLADFRDMDREDRSFFEDLIAGAEPMPPIEVLEGSKSMRLNPEMAVSNEIVERLFEEDLLDADDEEVINEARSALISLGFDDEQVEKALHDLKAKSGRRSVRSPEPFPTSPQKKRVEAKRRLNEEVNRAAKLLLNRLDLEYSGSEIAFKLYPGRFRGNNFVAAVQMINRALYKELGIGKGKRDRLTLDALTTGRGALEGILNNLTRELQARRRKSEQKG